MASQELNCKSDRQFHLSFSTVRAGCQRDHGNLNCRGYAVILHLNLMNILTQRYSFQIQATRQCRCLLAGQFNHCHLLRARLLTLNGWGKGHSVHLGRCCFGEGGGRTAACTLTSSPRTSATNIFVSAVQQWELGAAKNKLQVPARTSCPLTSDPKWQQTPY